LEYLKRVKIVQWKLYKSGSFINENDIYSDCSTTTYL